MTMTLGTALTADDDSAFKLDDSLITEGYDKASAKLNKEGNMFGRGAIRVGSFNSALKKAIMKSLDIALDDILGRAWSGWEDLRQYADPKQTPPEDINVVPVISQSIKSEHRPSVDVIVRGVKDPVYQFDIVVSVQLDVKGVNLTVQDGMIQEIELASMKLSGWVKLGNDKILEKEAAQVNIPGVMRLAKPIRIRLPHA